MKPMNKVRRILAATTFLALLLLCTLGAVPHHCSGENCPLCLASENVRLIMCCASVALQLGGLSLSLGTDFRYEAQQSKQSCTTLITLRAKLSD